MWEGEDGELYPWAEYRAKYPERRARFTTFIDGAEPAKYSRFDIFNEQSKETYFLYRRRGNKLRT